MTRTLGAVLAGGRSARFGSDKALALWRGRTLIDHGFAILDTPCEQTILCGREAPGRLSVADRPGPDLGPLGGLNAALHFAHQGGFRRVVTIGCDTPDVPESLIRTLLGHEGAHVLDSVPIIGCWPVDLADSLDRFVTTHPTRSVRAWIDHCGAVRLPLGDVANINRPDDLEALSHGIARSRKSTGTGDC